MGESTGDEGKLLVASADQSFGRAVVTAVEATDATVRADYIGTPGGEFTRGEDDNVDGAIVDGQMEEATTVVSRLTSDQDLPVVVLTDSTENGDSIGRLIKSGATDIFPRTTASAQYELVVERLASEACDSAPTTNPAAEGQPYQKGVEKLSDKQEDQDTDTGELLRVDDRRSIERRLRTILERIDEAVYFTRAEKLTNPSLDPDDFYVGYEDIWGRPLEEIFDAHEEGFFATLHPDEHSGFLSFIADIAQDIESGSVSDRYSREYRINRADGELRWIRSEFYPTEWETGPLRMVIVSRDITERKRREREYEQIFNGVEDGLLIMDPDTLDILNVNDAYLKMFGYDSLETIQKMGVEGLSRTKEGFTVEQGRKIHRRAQETGEPEVVEWRGVTVDGAHLLLEIKVTPALIRGKERSIVVHRDITERKRREQRLEVFNRILRHNLRNQLDVIRSHAEVLIDQTPSSHAEQIIAAVDELAEIGTRARETDRIMSMDHTPVEIDLSESLREIVEATEATQTHVTVTTDLKEETRLRTHKEVVTVAVESALENALDHAESSVTVALEDNATGYLIKIKDDGPGIPAEELVPIKAGKETNLQHLRGLGLWQLRWGVDKLNGELSFDTKEGTTVRIAVPDQHEVRRFD
jgi:PAS domain S-box-containing protein